jgi:hypothetical protein
VRLFGAEHRKHFPLYCCHVLKGGVYRLSRRNGSSSILACIRCRENVYGHSSIVIETAHMSRYSIQWIIVPFFLRKKNSCNQQPAICGFCNWTGQCILSAACERYNLNLENKTKQNNKTLSTQALRGEGFCPALLVTWLWRYLLPYLLYLQLNAVNTGTVWLRDAGIKQARSRFIWQNRVSLMITTFQLHNLKLLC